MAARSLNKATIIGNLTRDPELRYTPQGTAVCTFGVATNRDWTVESGEKKEETEFHRVVAWNKLAELCSQLLFKGRRVYIEGRLQTRQWEDKEGGRRQTTEIVSSEMIVLDNKRADDSQGASTYSAGNQSSGQTSGKDDLPEVDIAEESQKKVKEAAEEATTAKPKASTAEKKEDSKPKADEAKKADSKETTSKEVSDDIPF